MKHSERGHARLEQSLRMLSEIEAASETPSRIETALMARWDAEHDPRRRARQQTRRVVRAATAMAAGITIFGALAWQHRSTVRLKPETTAGGGSVSGSSRTSGDQYTTVAVVGGPLMAGEPIRVVRMRVARSVLGDLGVPSSAPRGSSRGETVDIDVLVGEDGVARGVRVPISEL
jgi:hypothetical protein